MIKQITKLIDALKDLKTNGVLALAFITIIIAFIVMKASSRPAQPLDVKGNCNATASGTGNEVSSSCDRGDKSYSSKAGK